MLETSARLLRLLSLLQSTRDLTGPQLSERLGVTTRTIRTDIERLRTLGYPVTGAPGRTGGYRLGAGAVLPPLLLDDEEAIAVAVGLRIATEGGVEGIAESSQRALSKLEQVLPPRLRYRVQALQDATATLESPGPTVSPDVVMAIAGAIRDHQQLRFDYTSHDGSSSSRTAEPSLLVHTRGRWYLAAWDVDRLAWRTFRADRILPRFPHGRRFTPRPPPQEGLLAHVERSVGSSVWRYRSRVVVHAWAEAVAAKLPRWAVIEPMGDDRCVAHVGSDNPSMLAIWLGALDADFEVDPVASPELASALRVLGSRFLRAAADSPAVQVSDRK